jgi:hypothetical protein
VDSVAKPPRNVARQQVRCPAEVHCKFVCTYAFCVVHVIGEGQLFSPHLCLKVVALQW